MSGIETCKLTLLVNLITFEVSYIKLNHYQELRFVPDTVLQNIGSSLVCWLHNAAHKGAMTRCFGWCQIMNMCLLTEFYSLQVYSYGDFSDFGVPDIFLKIQTV